MNPRRLSSLIFWLLLITLLAACSRSSASPTAADFQSPTLEQRASTPSAAPPSPTAPALAASVNGWAITLAEYQVQLALFQAAFPITATEALSPTQAAQQVLDNLINEALLAQAAQEAGYRVDDASLQTRLDQLAASLGSPQALDDWIANMGFDADTFRMALRRAMAAAWMRDQIINAVPTTAEQLHVRQILLYNSNDAEQMLAQLQHGADFTTLAFEQDPVTGGDLGWFPRGYLTEPEVEAAAFLLQPGQYSPIITTPMGFHIVQVIEREAQRPLEPSARLILQEKALQGWLQNRYSQSEVKIFVP